MKKGVIAKIFGCIVLFLVNFAVLLERIRNSIIFEESFTIVQLLVVLLSLSVMLITWLIIYDLWDNSFKD